MPCWTRQITTVEMTAAKNTTAMTAALLKLGAVGVTEHRGVSVEFQGGRFEIGKGITLDGYLPTAANDRISSGIRKAYGQEVVSMAARRLGWQATEAQGSTVLRRR